MSCITLPRPSGTPFASQLVMTFHCRFCRQDFVWEAASYALIWSRILVHFGQCARGSWLSRDARSLEARRAADHLVADQQGSARSQAAAPAKTKSSQRH